MVKEIIVRLKGEDKRIYKKHFICYEEGVVLSEIDPILSNYVMQTKNELKVPIDECEVIVKMDWS